MNKTGVLQNWFAETLSLTIYIYIYIEIHLITSNTFLRTLIKLKTTCIPILNPGVKDTNIDTDKSKKYIKNIIIILINDNSMVKQWITDMFIKLNYNSGEDEWLKSAQ